MVEDVPHLGRGQSPVDGHGDGPEVVGGEDHLEELGAVVGQEPDDISLPDTTFGEAAGKGNGARFHLGVCRGPTLEHGDRPVGCTERMVRQHAEPVHVGFHVVGPSHCARLRPRRWRPSGGPTEFFGPGLVPTSVAPMSVQATGESRRSPKWEQRRQAIVDTSAQVFARQGYHATGIMELCAANDLGKGALYHYIGSKEELLAAIHNRVMDEVMVGADRVAHAGGSPTRQLAMLGDELIDVIHRYPDHVWVFLHEFPALTGDRADQFRKRRQAYERRVEDVLRAGVASGDFRDLDPWLVARAWLGMHNYTYLWLKPEGRLSARSVARPFAEIFIRGIRQSDPEDHGAE